MIKTDFIDGAKNPNDICEYIEFAYERFNVLNVAIGWDNAHQRERIYITYEYDYGMGLDLHSLICEVFKND